MEISAIEQRTFPISRRGYDRDEVDTFLQTIAAEYRRVVTEYRRALELAKEAADRAAAAQAATQAATQAVETTATSDAQTFENVGSHVTSILAAAAQAAENLKTEAEQHVLAIRSAAEYDAAELRNDAETYSTQAKDLMTTAEHEAEALRSCAQSDVDTLIAKARERASAIEGQAKEEAARLERVSRANVEVIITEARRDFEHLRALQQECIDRLTSAEFLIKQARDGVSGSPLAITERVGFVADDIEQVVTTARRGRTPKT